jgi:hypothetical protein
MRIIYLLLSLLFVTACSEATEKETQTVKPDKKPVSEDLETRARRHVESRLGINGTEKYTIEIYRENLDGDQIIDAIITVNRLEYAFNEAAQSKNPSKNAELGFMGNYNYMFYYDGRLDKISPEINIPSSPNAMLKVQFESIASENYKDILVDYRVLNASFRNFYTVIEHTPRHVFQWKVFDGLNKQEKEAYHFVYDRGTLSSQKDIVVMKAKMKDPGKVKDMYTFEPELIPTSEEIYRFFYFPKEGKYMTKK